MVTTLCSEVLKRLEGKTLVAETEVPRLTWGQVTVRILRRVAMTA